MTRICVVVPCYNEEQRLPVNEFHTFLSLHAQVSLLFVNDGSTDGTDQVLASLAKDFPEIVGILNLEKNGGKAEAVRRGMMGAIRRSDFDYVGYFDADLATPLAEVFHLIEEAEKFNASMAFGSRVKRLGTCVDRAAWRHYVGRVFATEASVLLGLPVYDTQCGAKLFKASLVPELFKEKFISRWFFDVEIFFRMAAFFGRTQVEREAIEVPLNTWVEKGATKVTVTDFLFAPVELLRIFLAYRKLSQR
jgi:glycosyltransferase involved in cell wall biosynthesis